MELAECLQVLRAGFAAPSPNFQAAESLLDSTQVFKLAAESAIRTHSLPRGRESKELRG